MVPGRVVYAKAGANITETFANAVQRSDAEGTGITIGPDFKIEYINDT